MKTLRRFRNSLGFLVLIAAAGLAIAQTESQIESDEVKRVGSHLNCQCGSCNENLNCMMSAGQCHFCKPARTKIFQMQQAGASDDSIFKSFINDYGQKIFRPDPNSSFWLVPYFSLGAGGLLLWFVLRRMRGRAGTVTVASANAAPLDPNVARYMDAAEKETAKLE